MNKIISPIVLWLLTFGSSFADTIPEYEGVYIRTNSGSLIELTTSYQENDIPRVAFRTTTVCDRCLWLTFDAERILSFPPDIYRNIQLVDMSDVKGFVIKQRSPVQDIFLAGLSEIKELTDGTLLPEKKSEIGRDYVYVYGSYVNRRRTTSLDTQKYTFPDIRQAEKENYKTLALEKLPPFLSDSECGFNSSSDNRIRIKLLDQFTTEFVFEMDLENIGAVNKIKKCGASAHLAPLYAWNLDVGSSRYLFAERDKYNLYVNKFRDGWGPDVSTRLLPR